MPELLFNMNAEFLQCLICAADCRTSSTGREYAGRLAQTVSGLQCQRWDSQSPHPHNLTDPNRFPDASLAEAVNFCRNPDSRDGGPWCFTLDPDTEWEFCDILDCEGKHIIIIISVRIKHMVSLLYYMQFDQLTAYGVKI